MQVRDIYNKEVISINKDARIEEAANIMVEKSIGGLPVVDNEGSLVGIITEKDIIGRHKKIMPLPYIDVLGAFIYLEDPGRANEELKKALAINVEEVMTTPVTSVSPEDDIDLVMQLIVAEGINRIPVEEDGKLVGVIARNDVLKGIMQKNKEE